MMLRPWAALVLGWLVIGIHGVAAQEEGEGEDDVGDIFDSMTDPADRTYPTTITSTYSTTYTGVDAAVTVDHITVIDEWAVSPEPESMPLTKVQTQVTQRVVSAEGAAEPTMLAATTAEVTFTLWSLLAFDMSPVEPPSCPGPDGCSPPTVKPNQRCIDLGFETRCMAQCLLRDWMWWCSHYVEGQGRMQMGRVCVGDDVANYEELLEPCDHTDFATGCELCPEIVYEEM